MGGPEESATTRPTPPPLPPGHLVADPSPSQPAICKDEAFKEAFKQSDSLFKHAPTMKSTSIPSLQLQDAVHRSPLRGVGGKRDQRRGHPLGAQLLHALAQQ